MENFRHEKTGKAASGSGYQGDLARELTAEGIERALVRRGRRGAKTYDRVSSSPLLRARQTAKLLAGLEDESSIVLLENFGVYDPALGGFPAIIDEMFETYGYSPLRTYCAANQEAMNWYGNHALGDIESFLRAGKPGETTLNVAHAVLLPAAFLLAVRHDVDMTRRLLDLNLVESGGFTVTFENGIPRALEIHNDPI